MPKNDKLVIPSGNDDKSRDAPWTFRPYPIVLAWWKAFNRDGHWKRGQACNLALAKFMGKGDHEIEELYKNMRGLDNEEDKQ